MISFALLFYDSLSFSFYFVSLYKCDLLLYGDSNSFIFNFVSALLTTSFFGKFSLFPYLYLALLVSFRSLLS